MRSYCLSKRNINKIKAPHNVFLFPRVRTVSRGLGLPLPLLVEKMRVGPIQGSPPSRVMTGLQVLLLPPGLETPS